MAKEFDNTNRGSISQDEIKSVMRYDSETGICTRIKCTANRHKLGEVIGSYDKTTGYLRVTFFGTKYWLHRLIWLYMTGEMPIQIDHINHNGFDNRFSNLRNSTQTENLRNRTIHKRSNTGVTGVYKRGDCNSYSVEICKKKLGTFKSFFDAVCVRKSAEKLFDFHINHGKSHKELLSCQSI